MSSFKTDHNRARGLGAAKHGAGVGLARADFSGAQAWMSHPLNAVLLFLLISISFVHMHAGMRVIIEDYIHTPLAKASCLLANLFVCGLFGALAVFAVLKVALAAGAI